MGPKGDVAPKALACYGLLRTDTHEVLLRFVDGRPVSRVTTAFLAWLCQRLAAERKRVLVLLWGNASWEAGHCRTGRPAQRRGDHHSSLCVLWLCTCRTPCTTCRLNMH